MGKGSILVNLSGRGDKDLDYVIEHYGYGDDFKDFDKPAQVAQVANVQPVDETPADNEDN